jgi:hypothetical protein
VLLLPTTVVGLSADQSASAGPVTATSVLTAAKAALAAQKAVHLAVYSHAASSKTTERVSADLGPKSGTETISEGQATITIRLTPKAGYLSGSPSGLSTFVDMPAAEIKKVGKDWIVVAVGSSQYSSLKNDVLIGSIAGVLPAAKGTTVARQNVKGTNLYVLSWTTAASGSTPKLSNTLTLSATGATLPIEETTTASGSRETLTLSKWGERVDIAAPPAGSTIPFSKVSG